MNPDDLSKLRNALETNIERILRTFEFQNVFTRKTAPVEFEKKMPRAEIKAEIGDATGRRQVFSDATVKFNAWQFVAAVQIVTAPSKDGGALHESMVSAVRHMALSFGQASWADLTNWPLHYIAEPIRTFSIDDEMKDDRGVESSVMSFGGVICIRKNAWNI